VTSVTGGAGLEVTVGWGKVADALGTVGEAATVVGVFFSMGIFAFLAVWRSSVWATGTEATSLEETVSGWALVWVMTGSLTWVTLRAEAAATAW
jgi:hypothetical protein